MKRTSNNYTVVTDYEKVHKTCIKLYMLREQLLSTQNSA